MGISLKRITLTLFLITIASFDFLISIPMLDQVVWPDYKSIESQPSSSSSNYVPPTSSKMYPAQAPWQQLQKGYDKDKLPLYKEEIPKPYETPAKEYIPKFSTANSYPSKQGRSLGTKTVVNKPVVQSSQNLLLKNASPVDIVELDCKTAPDQIIKWYKADENGVNSLVIAEGDHVIFKDDHYVIKVDADHSKLVIYEPSKEQRAGVYSCTSPSNSTPLQTFKVFT